METNKLKKMWNIILITYLVAMVILIMVFGMTFGTLFIAGVGGGLLWLVGIHLLYKKHQLLLLRVVRDLTSVILVVLLCTMVIIIGCITAKGINTAENVNKYEYVIILGAGLKGEEVSNRLKARLDTGLDYLETHPESKVILSGGQGPDELISEAEAMGRYLIKNGINQERIYYEKESTSTVENIRYSMSFLEQLGAKGQKILIVTSDYHIYRALGICDNFQLDADGLSSRTPITIRINYVLREYLACIKDLVLPKLNPNYSYLELLSCYDL